MQNKNRLLFYTFFTLLHMLLTTWPFLQHGLANGKSAWIFNVLTWVTHSAFYVVIALVPLFLFERFCKNKHTVSSLLAVLLASLAILLIHVDAILYDMYSFHFNGFVWNLVSTKGGIESLGGGNSTYISIAWYVTATLLIQYFSWKLADKIKLNSALLKWRYAALLIFSMLLAEKAIYGLADIKNQGATLDSAYIYPLYKKVTFQSLAVKLGVPVTRKEHHSKLAIDTARLQYPLHPVQFSDVTQPVNIVILAAESLRWDRLTPEMMPNAYALAKKGQWFQQHYSSGNGTREGLFGMFYGLYGSYWSSFLHAQQSPLMMDRVQALGYQLDIRTSARFSYPEFDKTLFVKVPLSQLKEADSNLTAWQNDEKNASELIKFLQNRDKQKPFFSFFFFESTHARYAFPQESVIASPYLKDVNYWSLSRKELAPKIGELKNRYTNAAHWVDKQIGRVLVEIEKQGLLENTVIIITGDHGEEFMEKGFWGHNSSFVEEQTHTPMVVWWPGKPAKTYQYVTSHLDISPTLLQKLGAPIASINDYSLGKNIFEAQYRDYTVLSDWHSIGVKTGDLKYRIPYIASNVEQWSPTDEIDQPVAESELENRIKNNQAYILQAMKNCSLFLAKRK